MTAQRKFWVKASVITAGALLLLVGVALVTVQSQWFQNYVQAQLISTVEESTGGKVEIGSFRFDPWSLTVRVRDFTLHGTEPKGTMPLAHVALLELHLRLFAGLKKTLDLVYLGIGQPKVNVIVNPDGSTNIPSPKVKKPASQKSGLETVVDLAVGQFQIDGGVMMYSQKASAFSASGRDLKVVLNFNAFNSTYTGRILINPLQLSTSANAPVNVQVNLPLLLERDAVNISGGRLATPLSQILVNAGLRNLNSPKITAHVNASLAWSDLGVTTSDATQRLTVDVNAGYDDQTNEINIQAARLASGKSNFEASGTVVPTGKQGVQFQGDLALDELSRLFKISEPRKLGRMQLHGHLKSVSARNLDLDAVVNALGGNADFTVLVENFQKLTLNGRLDNFAIDQSGYSGVLGGTVIAHSDLKAKGTAGLTAQARIMIAPGHRGVPVNGQINGEFIGASNTVRLDQSFVALPHSRVDLSGEINKQLNVLMVSRNLIDFSPLAPRQPVSLQGGSVRVEAQVKGNLPAPEIRAHAALDQFTVRGSSFNQAALDVVASPAGATFQNGTLKGAGLNATFDGSIGLRKWQPTARSPVNANVDIVDGQLSSLLALAGQKDDTAAGTVSAQIHVTGTYGDPLGNANVVAGQGMVSGQPFEKVQGHVDLAHELITLTNFEVDAAGGQVVARGSYHHPADSFEVGHADFNLSSNGIQLANVKPLQKQSAGVAGSLKLTADGSGDVRKDGFQLATIHTDFSATGLKVNNQPAGDLVAQAHSENGAVLYNVHSNFAGSTIQVNGSSLLSGDYLTKATASIKNLSIEPTLAVAGQSNIPAKGLLSLNGNISGTIAHPDATFDVQVTKAMMYSEPLNSLSASVHYSPTNIELSNLKLDAPAGTLNAAAHFVHPDGDFNNGQVQVHLTSSSIDLSKIKQLPVTGKIKMNADFNGSVKAKLLLLSNATADLNATSLKTSDMNLGDLHFTATTSQHVVHYELNSEVAKSSLKATGQTELNSQYVTHAKVTFANMRYSDFQVVKPTFDVQMDGDADVNGPVLNPDALTGRMQMRQIAFDAGTRSRRVHLETDAPAVLELDHSVIKVDHFKIQDSKSYLEAAGSFSLKNPDDAMDLKLASNVDMGILQDVDRDFYSAGNLTLAATLHGSLTKPKLNGRVDLKNASVNYIDVSNGLSNGNGTILLNGTNASIQTLTGESGGGKVSISGFAGLTPTGAAFNLTAAANKVRSRYADTSITSNADINLSGNLHRSTLSGTVTVQRIAYSSSSDVGSFLSSASAPPSSPAAPSPFLSGMHLDLRIVTAADLRVVSTYSDKLSLISNLTVSGTAQNPGIVGSVSVTNGQLVFFGNTYTVNTGKINFYNANAIQPILDLSLETLTQGVDVTLGVRGSVDNLKLSYRSDPPLSFEQIVQLLATNTTPADPTIAAHQPTPPQQSTSQLGESAVLGQAVANPLASRVQRVFGLSQFKIDPSLSGSNGQPSARVTLQQKIASNLTFTYITDVTQTNSQIIRVTLDISPKLSAVALRDYNGNVSVELFYKVHVR